MLARAFHRFNHLEYVFYSYLRRSKVFGESCKFAASLSIVS